MHYTIDAVDVNAKKKIDVSIDTMNDDIEWDGALMIYSKTKGNKISWRFMFKSRLILSSILY